MFTNINPYIIFHLRTYSQHFQPKFILINEYIIFKFNFINFILQTTLQQVPQMYPKFYNEPSQFDFQCYPSYIGSNTQKIIIWQQIVNPFQVDNSAIHCQHQQIVTMLVQRENQFKNYSICLKYINLIKEQSQKNLNKQNGNQKMKNIEKVEGNNKSKRNQMKLISKMKFNPARKHINQLWGNQLIRFLKFYKLKYQISNDQLTQIKKSITRNLKLPHLVQILKQHAIISNILQKQQISFLDFIYKSTILSNQSKLILFETYDLFIEAVTHPENFKTWDRQQRANLKESQRIYQQIKDKNLQEIIEFVNTLVLLEKKKHKSNKCSSSNNITYHWIRYIKEMTSEDYFVKKFSNRQQFTQLLNSFHLRSPSIQTVQKALSISWLAQYISVYKIGSLEIIRQIMMNIKVNLLSKFNMIISLPALRSALKNPSSLNGWI